MIVRFAAICLGLEAGQAASGVCGFEVVDLREQNGWDDHARFMDSLVDDGFIVLGGPLGGEREILHAISAPSEQAVRERLAQDNWAQNGMLTIRSVEPWTILLDGRTT